MNAVTREPIMKIVVGFMAAKQMFTASDIGLFEALAAGPFGLDALSQRTGVPPRTLRIVADSMVAQGLLELDGNAYRNGAVADAFLAGKPGDDLRPVLRLFDRIVYPLSMNFGKTVRAGKGEPHFGQFSEEEQQIFSAGVECFSAPTAAALARAYDFGAHRRMLDVSGGTGSYLLAVLRGHAALRGTLFELPGPCAVARAKFARESVGARIEIVEGDLFRDPLPAGHDVLLVANTVHVLSPEQNLQLMKKLRAGATAGTRLLLIDLWTDPTHTQPLFAALMAGEFLMMGGEGQAYSEDDVSNWLEETGWRKRERKPLAGPVSLIVAEAI